MKVLAIVGSPRTNGNTYKVINQIRSRGIGSKIQCGNYGATYRHMINNLKQKTPQYIWGCGTYIDRGEGIIGIKNMSLFFVIIRIDILKYLC